MRQFIFWQAGKAALVCAAMALIAAPCRAADDGAEKIITKSFAVEPGGSVTVTADQGDIEVVTGKQNAVEVVVEREVKGMSESQAGKIRKKQKVTATLEGNTVYVDARFGKVPQEVALAKREPGLTVRIRISVPKRFDAHLETYAGTIEATGLQGAVEAKTSGGDMTFTHIHGAVNGQSSGGNIRVTGGTDKLQVRTSGGAIVIKDYNGPGALADSSGGDISVTGCTGALAVKTSGGNISLENFTGPQASADTGGGTVTLELASALLADSFFRTSGGNITARLADGVAADLLATTDGGTIMTAIPVSATIKGRVQENKLEGKISGGGPKLVLKTSGELNIEILEEIGFEGFNGR